MPVTPSHFSVPRSTATERARPSAIARTTACLAAAATLALAVPLAAQSRAAADSARARRDTLETVTVRAVRAAAPAPGAQHTIAREEIRARYVGEDAPLFLQRAPSVTAYTESGAFSGYSYIRLRGVEQNRLNISFDGVPLNDPEDQVLYFSNVAGFMQSVQSVQVTRGVGASGFGTASYAGSLNFASVPLASTPQGGDVQLLAGSFNTQGVTAQYATGVSPGGFAAYGRVTAQRTDGFRRHSGNEAKSTYLSAGWFGTDDAVKLSGFAGLSGTRMAYYASDEAVLAVDRRDNPLTDAESDLFHQEMVNLQWTHALSDALHTTLTVYRNSAAGAYDVNFGSGAYANYFLGHAWLGAIGAVQFSREAWRLDAGVHVSDYHREHAMAMRPTLATRLYDNTGYKQEQSAFAKLGFTSGSWRFSSDLQLRRAAFQYHPSAAAGIAPFGTDWTFFNPKLAAAYSVSPRVELFASWGRTGREPSRGDLFAGADDIDASTVGSILPLSRVRPERLDDFEAGIRWSGARSALTVNLFAMEFRDEVLPIGALALTGSPLRTNVARSYRRGIEFDASWRPADDWTATANLTVMQARIAQYTDQRSTVTYRDVEPIATPPLLFNQSLAHQVTSSFSWDVATRYVDRAHLANDGNAALVTPAWWILDLGTTVRFAGAEWRGQLLNAADAKANAGGYVDSGKRAFYPLAGRNVQLSVRLSF